MLSAAKKTDLQVQQVRPSKQLVLGATRGIADVRLVEDHLHIGS
jgi:hypothetical protein